MRCAASLRYESYLTETYRTFWHPHRGGGRTERISLDLKPASRLAAPHSVARFRAGSWSLYESRGGSRIVGWGTDGRPQWILGTDSDSTPRTVVWRDRARPARAAADPLHYPLDQLLVMVTLATRSGAIFHSVGMETGGRAYVFAGRSRAGKTTLARLLMRDPEVRGLSDDRVIVRGGASRFRAYGTPWPGEGRVAVNASAPLSALFVLAKGPSCAVRRLSPREAVHRLIPTISVPWFDAKLAERMLAWLDRLTGRVPCYEFCFTPDRKALHAFRRFVRGDQASTV